MSNRLLDQTGDGSWTTQDFSPNAPWQLRWWYRSAGYNDVRIELIDALGTTQILIKDDRHAVADQGVFESNLRGKFWVRVTCEGPGTLTWHQNADGNARLGEPERREDPTPVEWRMIVEVL